MSPTPALPSRPGTAAFNRPNPVPRSYSHHTYRRQRRQSTASHRQPARIQKALPDPEPARYPVKIDFGALRNPPDVSALTAVNADLEFYLTGEFTEAEFAAISDQDLR